MPHAHILPGIRVIAYSTLSLTLYDCRVTRAFTQLLSSTYSKYKHCKNKNRTFPQAHLSLSIMQVISVYKRLPALFTEIDARSPASYCQRHTGDVHCTTSSPIQLSCPASANAQHGSSTETDYVKKSLQSTQRKQVVRPRSSTQYATLAAVSRSGPSVDQSQSSVMHYRLVLFLTFKNLDSHRVLASEG